MGVIAVLTLCFVLSAVTGIERGVQYLSNANAIAALVLVLFLFVVGPTVFIMGTFTESLGGYFTHLPAMAFRTGAFGGTEWVNGWTVFYWAWWISWTPFVGMFIARISKGRTIRQFVVYVILVPSLVSFIWFSIMAGSAFGLQLNQGVDLGAIVNSDGGTERVLFETLREYPLASVTVVLAVFLIAIFFITGADSASIVMGMLSQHGTEHPMRSLVIFWGVAQGAVAAVLLWSGGLSALQTLVIIVAGPFMLVIIAMCVSLMKALRDEPYEATLPSRVRRAVLHAQEHDLAEHQTVALAALGAETHGTIDRRGGRTSPLPARLRPELSFSTLGRVPSIPRGQKRSARRQETHGRLRSSDALGFRTETRPQPPGGARVSGTKRFPLVRLAEDRGFEPLRAVNPTRFPSERHRPLGESSAGEATRPDSHRRNRPPRLSANPPCGGNSLNPPGPEGSKGRWALPGAWGAFWSPAKPRPTTATSPADRGRGSPPPPRGRRGRPGVPPC